MATKRSKVMNPAPGPKPGPMKAKQHHPAQQGPAAFGDHPMPNAAAGKGGGVDAQMRASATGPRPMLSPVNPGKNQMNSNPR